MDEVEAVAFIRRRRERRRRTLILRNRRRLQEMRDKSDPFMLPEEAFRGMYRLNKDLTLELVEELRPHLPAATRSSSTSPELKVLCALHVYGQGSYQKSAGSDSHLGLSQSSVSRCLEEVTDALNAPAVQAKWIPYPLTAEERIQVIQKNFRACRFPGVIGFVDGTHLSINAPSVDEHLYVNRKGYHSVNVQIICDSDLLILNCVARFPGSTHNSYIWSQSEAFHEMRRVWEGGEHCWLLGDSGYPHQPWLQTPIHNAVDGSPEARYNELHTRARCAVERCIGVWKNRFRCLLRHRALHYSPGKTGRIVNACSVLHNMCVRGGVPMPEAVVGDEDPFPATQPPLAVETIREVLREACNVREGIVNRMAP